MISVRPDPAHPRGGYAEVSLPESALDEETTQVAVFDNYSERYLGEAGWQPSKVLFGPYDVRREGGQARLVIGPEIVNQIEEYANVRLMVGDAEQDIAWPDEVVPAPGAAKIGGIMGTKAKEMAAKGTLTARIGEPEAPPAPQAPAEVDLPEVEADQEDEEEVEKGGRTGMLLGLLAMLVVGAGLAYWLLNADGTPPAEPVAAPVAAPAPLAEADPCTMEALGALSGFAAQSAALRECGGKASADAALGLLERAASAGDAQALTLFGTVYDGAVQDAVIEEQIGLTFDDRPATAAEYYARAVAAGSEEAAEKLGVLCERMAGMTDTLIVGAVADYCGN